MDSPVADINLDMVIDAIKPVANENGNRIKDGKAAVSIFTYATVLKLRGDDPATGSYSATCFRRKPRVHPSSMRRRWTVKISPCLFAGLAERFCQRESPAMDHAVRLSQCQGRQMTWDEIDLRKRIWTIPEHRTKQRREVRLPVTDAMRR